jgi:Fic family protein
MTFDPRIPYDDLPLLPPRVDIESKAVLKQALAASRVLAELKGAGGLIPDQAMLINSIPLQEAKLSSEIENIVTTQDNLYHAALDERRTTDPQTKEVLRYRTALRQGYENLKIGPLSLETLREVCGTLLDKPVQFRGPQDQVYIGNRTAGTVTYTPPNGGPGLTDKLRNLEAYLLDPNGVDPLIRMAVAHYQFEAIHPFADGNGRTGRIMNILYLLHERLLEIPVLYLSRYIIHNKIDYYRLLRSVTEDGDWETWIRFVLRGIEETAQWTTDRLHDIRVLLDFTVERCRRELPKVYSKELVELVFRQPYCKIGFVVDAGIAKRKTASEYLKELERIGILAGETKGREVIYRHPALLEVLAK